jgi:hypothetical protein
MAIPSLDPCPACNGSGSKLAPSAGHMGGLAASLVFLLAEAAELPDPEHMSVFGILNGNVHDSVSFQFWPDRAGGEAVVSWGLAFGGVITANTVTTDDGALERWVRTDFTWHDLEVAAFTHIPLPSAEAITATDHQAEPETVPPS